ncbi:MAG: cation-translocating P-type ATPase C-terminal domain-containing protein, partial [Parabacteroides sp.]|nr:cation-translocating P-type ATPase C-terminal domain-containing protein [Parabacteroides sp.]
ASFGVYFNTLAVNPDNAPLARALGLAVIMLANLFLVQVNSSDHDRFLRSFSRLAKDKVMWAVNIGTVAMLLIILYTPLSGMLKLAAPSVAQLLMAFGLAAVSVLWYELVKLFNRVRAKK